MKKYLQIALAVLLSIAIWLIYNLSQPQTELVTVAVLPQSNIDGHAAEAAEEVSVAALCNASAFTLMKAEKRGRAVVKVAFDPADFVSVGSDMFKLTSSVLFRHATDIFGSDVTVQSVVSGDLVARFPKENHKKVPVLPMSSITYRQQYIAKSPIKVYPDSVIVYGDPARIESIRQVFTTNIAKSDVHRSWHKEVALEPISGVRLSDSKVSCSMDVSRYVEIRVSEQVKVKGAPEGAQLVVYPGSVEVIYTCLFPLVEDPAGAIDFYVDYNEFASSLTGRCLVRHDWNKEGVISVTVSPEICECFEQ